MHWLGEGVTIVVQFISSKKRQLFCVVADSSISLLDLKLYKRTLFRVSTFYLVVYEIEHQYYGFDSWLIIKFVGL
jgi:hypothetical protein